MKNNMQNINSTNYLRVNPYHNHSIKQSYKTATFTGRVLLSGSFNLLKEQYGFDYAYKVLMSLKRLKRVIRDMPDLEVKTCIIQEGKRKILFLEEKEGMTAWGPAKQAVRDFIIMLRLFYP